MRFFAVILSTVLFITTPIEAQQEGDLCVMAGTIQPGVCRHIMRCSVVLEAVFHGLPYQVCASPENRLIVCCPWVPGQETRLQARYQSNTTTPREGDNCTMMDTGSAGVCSQFGNCHTAIEAASKGKFPQVCALEGNVQIVCCPLVTVFEGDQCTLAETGRAGKCLRISKCPVAVEAALKGLTPQICAFDYSVPVVCCEGVIEGDNCTMVDTGKTGVCRPFANCQIAKEAAYKGISPQICALEDRVQIVCCPPVTVIEGDNCTLVDTGKAGVCRPFATCQTAKEAASKGFFPQTCDVEGTVQTVCCPLSTVVEGDNCSLVDTGRAGVCRPFANCQTAKVASYKGIFPQTCDVEGSVQIVCCPPVTVIEGDNCTMLDTGRAGVCRPFANCQTAKEAAYKGISPQICALEGRVQIVCCPPVTVIEGDNCTVADTGMVGVCRPFASCHTAKDAASKGIFPQTCDVGGAVRIVCCPLSTAIEGSICLTKDTKIAGVYKPFANCQTAMKAASEGTLPQIGALEDNVQIVCCPVVIEGSNCTLLDTGMAGVCRSFANCRRAKKAAGRGVVPQKCDSTDNESELVCCAETDCPPLPKGLVTQLLIGSKAADYCIELAEKIHPCQETGSGWTRGDMLCPLLTPDSNIVYHKTPITTATDAPYYGRIGSGQRGEITWRRSPVSLVSDHWVLCTAKAIKVIGRDKAQFVGLGGSFTPRYNPDEIYDVTQLYIHPLYNGAYSTVYNSIALLQLDREVKFTSRVLPTCLHTGTPLPDSGFMFTTRTSASAEHKTSMQRVSQEECSKVFPTSGSQHPAGIKHDVEICSRPVNTTGECVGWYSGSPLTLPNNHRVACTHLLVGLAASRIHSPCTFTNIRISDFIPWIEGIVWPESGVVV